MPNKYSKMRFFIFSIILCFIASFSFASTETIHSNIIIFGDSLSDSASPSTNDPGNAINPRVWGQYLVLDEQGKLLSGSLKTYNDTGLVPDTDNINFAHGGATAVCEQQDGNCLETQLQQYFQVLGGEPSINPHTKIIIWITGNDILNATHKGNVDPAALITGIMQTIQKSVEEIEQREITTGQEPYKIYLIDLPDLSMIPAFNSASAEQKAGIKALSLKFADALEQLSKNPLINNASHQVILVKASDIFRKIDENLSEYGIAPPGDSGFSYCASLEVKDPNCKGFYFNDQIHPTTAVHAYIAHYFAKILFPKTEDSLKSEQ